MELTDLKTKHPEHWKKATALRMLAIDAVQAANSGHPGMPMGMADVATVLFEKHLKFDASAPDWADRDRFILSAGHGSMLLYGLLHLTGYADMTIEEIRNFRQPGAKTAGHPEYGYAGGIEITTGPLGQGIATSVGMAMGEASMAARFGKKLVDHTTYVIAGDGCLMEGISQEAIGLAGKQKLGKLIVLWDNNGITIDGAVENADLTDQARRFKASGWSVFQCDGHDPDSIDAAISAARKSRKPSLVDCKTHIGFGSPNKQDSSAAHGAPMGEEEIVKLREVYDWPHKAFVIPKDIKAEWEAIGAAGATARAEWEARLAEGSEGLQNRFARVIANERPKGFSGKINRFKEQISQDAPKMATRKSSEAVLGVINKALSETIGGSADLTGSNNTLTEGMGVFEPGNRRGRYVNYGIREHGMAAAMNGLALHGGCLPYGGTFMVFSDYMRGAMRLSSLMGLPVTYVLTHDSIGLGEDGPTHQPVEHLAMMRATPNLNVFRPADTVETAEAWEIAVTSPSTPSALALTRQGLPTLRTDHIRKNQVSKGAYVLAREENERRVILMASGSEVEIAMAARTELEAKGIGTRVVSMPCWELFEAQEEDYRRKVLPGKAVRVGIEAGARMGWDRWLTGERGNKYSAFIGMESFGASAPIDALYQKFGITADAVVAQVDALLAQQDEAKLKTS